VRCNKTRAGLRSAPDVCTAKLVDGVIAADNQVQLKPRQAALLGVRISGAETPKRPQEVTMFKAYIMPALAGAGHAQRG